ncbi:hypothetical protein Fmac_029714 [Flemingia macrophylla]|uniref:tRNA-uridine aminocarboxypropyltransferase n=1 Tax=Flemingia macrophylla TaxID=520843 RepID=A0ABD1LB37_9FABA
MPAALACVSATRSPFTPSPPPRASSSFSTPTRPATSSPPPPSSPAPSSTPPPSPPAASAPASPPPRRLSPALYLFPATPATDLSALRPSHLPPGLLLIAFDATWNHAREMLKASEPFLSSFATRVSLPVDESLAGGTIFDSDLILRKEPYAGCVTTMEAVARALRVLEPNGLQVEDRLIGILREMVRLQARFLKPVKSRPKLLKKKLEGKQKSEVSE